MQKLIEVELSLSASFAVSAMFPQIVIGRKGLPKCILEENFFSFINIVPIYHTLEPSMQSLYCLKCHKNK